MVIGCYDTSDGYQLGRCGQNVADTCSGWLDQLISRLAEIKTGIGTLIFCKQY